MTPEMISAYLAGLFGCYFVGLRIGATVYLIKGLGKSA